MDLQIHADSSVWTESDNLFVKRGAGIFRAIGEGMNGLSSHGRQAAEQLILPSGKAVR